MTFPYIRKHLGDDWLERELRILGTGNWIQDPSYTKYAKLGYTVFERIDDLIKKLEGISGFDKWALEAKTSKASFKDCLLEIMVLEHLNANTDHMEMKPEMNGLPVPEARLTTGNEVLLVEVKRLDGIPSKIRNKVSNLFTKIRKQFGSSSGIAFIGCSDFFISQEGSIMPKKEFRDLIVEVERRLLNPKHDRSIKAVFLVNIDIMMNPILKKAFFRKHLFLVRRPESSGGLSEERIRQMIEVDGFVEVSAAFFRSGV
jgi:hypothetical protein